MISGCFPYFPSDPTFTLGWYTKNGRDLIAARLESSLYFISQERIGLTPVGDFGLLLTEFKPKIPKVLADFFFIVFCLLLRAIDQNNEVIGVPHISQFRLMTIVFVIDWSMFQFLFRFLKRTDQNSTLGSIRIPVQLPP